jgi:hypothetical protein
MKKEEKLSRATRAFYQARFGILVYLETGENFTPNLTNQLKLKLLPLSALASFFQPCHSLKINLKENNNNNNNLEEYLLTHLPDEL